MIVKSTDQEEEGREIEDKRRAGYRRKGRTEEEGMGGAMWVRALGRMEDEAGLARRDYQYRSDALKVVVWIDA